MLTLGERGVRYADRDQRIEVPAERVAAVDTTASRVADLLAQHRIQQRLGNRIVTKLRHWIMDTLPNWADFRATRRCCKASLMLRLKRSRPNVPNS